MLFMDLSGDFSVDANSDGRCAYSLLIADVFLEVLTLNRIKLCGVWMELAHIF